MRGVAGRSGKRIESDPQLRAELELCDRWGISHSHFLGGPARWSDVDQAKALAYRAFVDARCRECGTAPTDWDPKFGGHEHAYIAQDITCRGCERIEELMAQVPSHVHGVKVVLTPRALVPDAW